MRARDYEWNQEELDILLDLTSKQLMKKDGAAVVWTEEHGANVSQGLREKGYVRTTDDCLDEIEQWHSYFRLTTANQTFRRAGWTDEECKIVLDMTAKEVERLVNWEASGIPTLHAVHWNRVSQELKDQGYIRSAPACMAYWVLARGETIPPFDSQTTDDGDETDNRASGDHVLAQYHPRRLSDILEEDERNR